jgi:membrane associated rhomboid family serine protease
VPVRLVQFSNPAPIVVQVPVALHDAWGEHVVRQPLTLPAEPWQIAASLLTCMFLHGSWWHLLGNMWFLGLFGNNVEDRLGPLPYLVLYVLGGVLASLAYGWFAPHSMMPVIGASGAVAAVLGAYAITWPWARVSTLVFLLIFITVIDVPALLVLGTWFGLQLWSSLHEATATGVAWWAHVGGFLAGVLLMPFFCLFSRPHTQLPEVIDVIKG